MHRKRSFRGAVLLAGLALVGLVPFGGAAGASLPAGADQPTTTFVGKVKELDAFLAVVIDADGALAYLCDGADVTDWFRGTNDRGALDLGASGGANLAAGIEKKKLDGVITLPDATTASFALRKATKKAGLFRAEQVIEDTGYVAGWVVLPDGSAYGRVESSNVAGARTLPPPPPVDETTPTTAPAKTPPTAVGTVAPQEIADAFPPDPPPDAEVTVVPFSTTASIDEAPGGGKGEPTGPADPGAGGSPPPPQPEACVDPDQIRGEIGALQAQLDETSEFRIRKRRAIQQQIDRLQGILDTALSTPDLNCTLPLA